MPSFNEAEMVSQNLAKIKICLAVKYDWVSYKKKKSFFCNLGAHNSLNRSLWSRFEC